MPHLCPWMAASARNLALWLPYITASVVLIRVPLLVGVVTSSYATGAGIASPSS